MNRQLRYQRNVFLMFLGACFVALMAGLPIVTGSLAQSYAIAQAEKNAAGGATAPARPAATEPEQPGFEHTDRNKDGFVDKGEAGVVPGLSANFERADRNRDGKLDQAEFARGLQILQVRR
jgi:hypothetical protein